MRFSNRQLQKGHEEERVQRSIMTIRQAEYLSSRGHVSHYPDLLENKGQRKDEGDKEYHIDRDEYVLDLTDSTFGPTTSDPSFVSSLSNMLREPMIQLFGIVFILFLLTAILATINFCIWYLERRRRRVPLHWRSSTGIDVANTRPISQTPKRSFHIQHALYKTVRRPSAMPP